MVVYIFSKHAVITSLNPMISALMMMFDFIIVRHNHLLLLRLIQVARFPLPFRTAL